MTLAINELLITEVTAKIDFTSLANDAGIFMGWLVGVVDRGSIAGAN